MKIKANGYRVVVTLSFLIGGIIQAAAQGSIGPATGAFDRTYDDGFVFIDSTGNFDPTGLLGNSGGITTYWGYQYASQVNGNFILFHSQTVLDANTFQLVTDTYSLPSGIAPPDAPYAGTFTGTVGSPLIQGAPFSRTIEIVPEPSSCVLFIVGIIALAGSSVIRKGRITLAVSTASARRKFTAQTNNKTKTTGIKSMKTLNIIQTLALGGLMAVMAGCSSTPSASDAKVGAVFQQPIEKAQKASVDALTVTGFDIQKQEPTYVEGLRPRKVGLFVGSGGETVGIWLTALAADKTEVKVKTARTFVGGAGQKSWDDEVLAEITKTLGK